MQRTLAGAGLPAVGIAVGAVPGTGADARARGGCGPGFHPNPYGICRPNGPPRDRFYGHGPRRRDVY